MAVLDTTYTMNRPTKIWCRHQLWWNCKRVRMIWKLKIR